jgi:hypothetical protein
MTRQKFVEQYLSEPQGSTVATRRATTTDKRRATGTNRVDYHIEQQTAKE